MERDRSGRSPEGNPQNLQSGSTSEQTPRQQRLKMSRREFLSTLGMGGGLTLAIGATIDHFNFVSQTDDKIRKIFPDPVPFEDARTARDQISTYLRGRMEEGNLDEVARTINADEFAQARETLTKVNWNEELRSRLKKLLWEGNNYRPIVLFLVGLGAFFTGAWDRSKAEKQGSDKG